MLSLPHGLGEEIAQITQQGKHDIHYQNKIGDDVQILERLVGERKRQMIILAEEGSTKLQQCGDQAEREKDGEKWEDFLMAVCEAIHGQITDGCKKWGPRLTRMLGVN